MHFRKLLRKLFVISSDPAGFLFYFLSRSLAVQRQPVHPGGTVCSPHSLDPATPDPDELSGYHLPQPGHFICTAHFCGGHIKFRKDRFRSDNPFHHYW